MDAVYVCRKGPNEELRYSLRSLVNLEHDRVWVFGGKPEWYIGKHVPVPQDGTKQANVKTALAAIIDDRRVSDPFLLFNDDFYAIEPAEARLYDCGPASAVIAHYAKAHPGGTYLAALERTSALLADMGHPDPLCYELHLPMPVRKDVLREVLRIVAEQHYPPLMHRTIHGALAGEPSETLVDVKVYGRGDPVPAGPWLSSCNRSFEHVQPLLARLFPDPCPHENEEDAMLYTSPKRVERNGVLVAFAGESMPVEEAVRRGLLTGAAPVAAPAPAPAPEPESEDLSALKMPELRAIAKERGIAVPIGTTKGALLVALR